MKRFFLALLVTALIFSSSVVFIDTDNTASKLSTGLIDGVITENVMVDGVSADNGSLTDFVSVEDKIDDTVSGSEDNLTQQTLSESFDNHIVTVAGKLPEGASLSLSAVDSKAVNELVAEMDKKAQAVFACDIKIIDAQGKEWQPDESVSVSISSVDVAQDEKLQFLHISDELDRVLALDNTAEAVETISKVSLTTDGEATFDAYGFSTYVGFTVDFHYNSITYSIAGMSEITLSQLFAQLQIQKDATTATSVVFSDDSLVSVSQQADGDWLLTSLEAFATEETLKITFADGEKIVIAVTDALEIGKNTSTVSAGGITVTPQTGTNANNKTIDLFDTTANTIDCYKITGTVSSDLTINIVGSFQCASGSEINVANGGSLTIKVSTANNRWIYVGENKGKSFVTVSAGGALDIQGYGASTTAEPSGYLVFSGLDPINTKKPENIGTQGSLASGEYTQPIRSQRVIHISGDDTGNDNDGKIYFSGIKFEDIISSSSAAIHLNGDRNTDIYYCKFVDLSSATAGSAIYCGDTFGSYNNSDMSIKGCVFNNCTTSKSGGAIYTTDTTSAHKIEELNIDNCTFTGCSASENFGAIGIKNRSSYFRVRYSTFTNCSATGNGGAIGVADGARITTTLNIKENQFTNCDANNGGAISFTNSDTDVSATKICGLKIEGASTSNYSQFTGCDARGANDTGGKGGAIAFLGPIEGTVYMDYLNINSCTGYLGSAILMGKGGTFTGGASLSNSTFTNNTCYNSTTIEDPGGTIRSTGAFVGSLTVDNCTIQSNKSYTSGGGIFWNAANKKITVKNSDISSNYAGRYGGGVHCASDVELADTNIHDNVACADGGGVCQAVYTNTGISWSGTSTGLTIGNNVKIYNNKSVKYGGGIAIITRYSVSIANTSGFTINFSMGNGVNTAPQIYNNTAAKSGGGVYYGLGSNGNNAGIYGSDASKQAVVDTYKKQINIYSGEIRNNYAAENGGGVCAIGKAAVISISNGKIHSNTTGQISAFNYINESGTSNTAAAVSNNNEAFGGGVYLRGEGSQCNISGSGNVVYSNKSYDAGGGIAVHSGTVNLTGSGNVIYNNEADRGGGIFSSNVGTVNVTGGNVYSNKAIADATSDKINTGCGGGILNNNSTVTVNGGSVTTNTAVNNGGGVYNNNSGTVTVSSGSVVSNTATNGSGGGVYSDSGTVRISGGNINDNTAKVSGGGIYNGSATVTVGGNVYSNKATAGSGGGIYTDSTSGSVSISGSVYSNEAGKGSGGGVYTNTTPVTVSGTVKDNKAYYNGGGVYTNSAKVDLSNSASSITGNYAQHGNGGGICTVTGEVVSGGLIQNNHAQDGGSGGGIYSTAAKLTLSGGSISNNSAAVSGGGVYAGSVSVSISGNVNDNTASTGNGGGLWNGSATVTISGSVYNNKATAGSGGGIYTDSVSCSVSISGSVYSNTAGKGNGGGVYTNATPVTVSGSVKDNKAYYNGGGVYTNTAKVDLSGSASSITGNYAQNGNGGGICTASGQLIVGGDITGNYAQNGGSGGGIYSSSAQITFSNGSISNNSAAVSGGGIYAGSNTVTISGNIQNNKALTGNGGGVYATGSAALITLKSGSSVTNNTAGSNSTTSSKGGALFVTGGADIIMESGTISGNQANYGGGLCAFENNSTQKLDSTITLNGGTITKNTATVYGGGVAIILNADAYDTSTATITVKNASITENTATNGGGGVLVVNYTNSDNSNIAKVMVTGGNISKNKVTAGSGGGIYCYTGTIQVDSGSITENIATNGGGGGIFADAGGNVTVNDGFITSNTATGSISGSPYHTTSFAGIGGGICLGSGTANNLTTFSMPVPENSKISAGIYDNIGYYAADDVFANGVYTDLDVPDFDEMDLSGLGNTGLFGWFEDYASKDANYSKGTALDKTSGALGSRYKLYPNDSSISTHIPDHDRKYLIICVDNPAENTGVALADDTGKSYVNSENTYVSMTLGEVGPGYLKVTKNIVSEGGRLINNDDNTSYTFRILHYAESGSTVLSAEEIAAVEYTVTKEDASTATTTGLGADGTFKLKGGESVFIKNLAPGNYVVEELLTGQEYQRKIKSISNKSYVETTDETSQGAGTTDAIAVVNNLTSVADFTNTLRNINVVIKYYNRDYSTNGDPADIDKKATQTNVNFTLTDKYSSLSQLISEAAVVVNDKSGLNDNILDEYYCYTTQTKAESSGGSGKRTHSNQYDLQVGDFVKYYNKKVTNYDDGTENEKWVTYKLGNEYRYEAEESDYKNSAEQSNLVLAQFDTVDTVTVWLRNSLKEYTYTVYQAKETSSVEPVGDGKFTVTGNELNSINTNGTTNTAYYNQRFGIDYHSGTQDGEAGENTSHLKNYGKSAWLTVTPTTAETITYAGTTYKFSYWAFDKNGKEIASTEKLYQYRIIGNLTLYPIYEKTPNQKIGLSVTKGLLDIYKVNGIEKTAINTIMNPYNCQIKDSNIKQAGVIYVIDSKGNATDAVDLEGTYSVTSDGKIITNMDKIGEVIKAMLTEEIDANNTGDTAIQLDLSQELSDLNILNGNFRVYYVANGVVLTNRNRVQFTEVFTKTALENRRILAYAAMYYAGDQNQWFVSDNCADYRFDDNGNIVKE